jgi:hypothetical protein
LPVREFGGTFSPVATLVDFFASLSSSPVGHSIYERSLVNPPFGSYS